MLCQGRTFGIFLELAHFPSRLYEFLKAKGIKLKTQGKSGQLNWDADAAGGRNVDHHLAKVQNEALEGLDSGDDSMSSDDSDFNPDNLEALSAKEEYDSEPSTTSSEGESSDGTEKGEEAEKRRAERQKRKEVRNPTFPPFPATKLSIVCYVLVLVFLCDKLSFASSLFRRSARSVSAPLSAVSARRQAEAEAEGEAPSERSR